MQELAVVTEASFGIRDSKPLVTLELAFLKSVGGIELTPSEAAGVLVNADLQFLDELVGMVAVVDIDDRGICTHIRRFQW